MFSKMINKISEFGNHHQVLIGVVIALSVICVSWGIEKILEHYIFPKKQLRSYLIVISMGLMMLWITQHFILNVF